MKSKRAISFSLAVLVMFTMVFATTTTAFAASGNKKVNANGSMTIALNAGQTGNSSTATFTVSGLPANAKITKLQINTGTMTYAGGMLTNYLILSKSGASNTEHIPWNGSGSTTLTSNGFLLEPANGTYTISFNCTCITGAIINGIMTNMGTKTYKNMTLTVYWDDQI